MKHIKVSTEVIPTGEKLRDGWMEHPGFRALPLCRIRRIYVVPPSEEDENNIETTIFVAEGVPILSDLILYSDSYICCDNLYRWRTVCTANASSGTLTKKQCRQYNYNFACAMARELQDMVNTEFTHTDEFVPHIEEMGVFAVPQFKTSSLSKDDNDNKDDNNENNESQK